MLSSVAAKMYFPLGENFTNDTGGLSSSINVLRHWPEAVSHIRLKKIIMLIEYCDHMRYGQCIFGN